MLSKYACMRGLRKDALAVYGLQRKLLGQVGAVE